MRLWRRIVVGCVMAIGILAGGMALGFQDLGRETDPLCASIEEDPCFSDGVFEIFCAKDYLRFAGYMNRARKEKPINEEARIEKSVILLERDKLADGTAEMIPLIQK